MMMAMMPTQSITIAIDAIVTIVHGGGGLCIVDIRCLKQQQQQQQENSGKCLETGARTTRSTISGGYSKRNKGRRGVWGNRYDAIRWDVMRCDVMRCDVMRCDAMRCDAMRCDTNDAMRYEMI